jgi:hypothetical protein
MLRRSPSKQNWRGGRSAPGAGRRCQSGEASIVGLRVRLTAPLPSAFITHMSPSRSKAMRLPSGDQAGHEASVRRFSSPPSALIVQMACARALAGGAGGELDVAGHRDRASGDRRGDDLGEADRAGDVLVLDPAFANDQRPRLARDRRASAMRLLDPRKASETVRSTSRLIPSRAALTDRSFPTRSAPR